MKNIFENKKNFKIDRSGKSIAIFLKKNLKVNKNIIFQLIKFSKEINKDNIRICMHSSKKDKIQNMINVIYKHKLVETHKHIYKDEIYHLIMGKMRIKIYNKNKCVRNIIIDKENFLLRLKKNTFHKILPITNYVVFHEIRMGTFKKNDSIFLNRIKEKKN